MFSCLPPPCLNIHSINLIKEDDLSNAFLLAEQSSYFSSTLIGQYIYLL